MPEDPTPQSHGEVEATTDAPPTATPAAPVRSAKEIARERTVDVAAAERGGTRRAIRIARKALIFAAALFLFVLAIQLMKGGAKAIAPSIEGSFVFDNGASTLGFGWLSAYVVLSGSPVAATALTLLDGGIISPFQTFTMLAGSRLGASFIVLLTGFLYAVRNRGRNRSESVGMGIQALSLTAIVYLPGLFLGYWFLRSGALDGVQWHASADLLSLVDYVWGPVESFLYSLVPGYLASGSMHPELWVMLPVGLGVLLASFKLLDSVLPQLSGERQTNSRLSGWLKRPWPMFLLGCLVATLTLSVSVALTVLVPLASRGYIKRKEAIPYIMGANITTLADTLVAAMLIGNAVAVQVVLAQAIGIAIVTVFCLAVIYRPLSSGVMGLDEWIVTSNRRLAIFVLGFLVLPVFFLTSGLWM